MTPVLRIATRASRLAVAQATLLKNALLQNRAAEAVELVTFSTRGDRTPGALAPVGGKGLFTAELEAALRSGEVDAAIHSAKDMPACMDPAFRLAAVLPREDPRDVLISAVPPELLPAEARIGTGSPRRSVQWRELYAESRIEPIRGNVETRLGRAVGEAADLDGVILASAGLIRCGLFKEFAAYIRPLPIEQMLPAAGQGVLAVQCLAEREDLPELLAPVHCMLAAEALYAERTILQAVNASCQSCIAVHAQPSEQLWILSVFAADPQGRRAVRRQLIGPDISALIAEMIGRLIECDVERLIRPT